ncbi:hypothetical protein PG987_000704 [Apiospora arundinis]
MTSAILLQQIELVGSRFDRLKNAEFNPDLTRVTLTMMSIDLIQIKLGFNDLVRSGHNTSVVEHSLYYIEEAAGSIGVLTQILDCDPESRCISGFMSSIGETLAILSGLLIELNHTYNQGERNEDKANDDWDWSDLAGNEDIGSAQEAQLSSEGANPFANPDSSEDASSSDSSNSSNSSTENTEPCKCEKCVAAELLQALAEVELIRVSYRRAKENQVRHRDT